MHNLCNIDIWYITSENLFTKTLTRSLKKDPSTVFSACDLDKLGKSAPLERAPKKIRFHRGWTRPARHHGANYRIKRCWKRDPHSFFIRVVSRASNSNGILARLQFGLPGQKCKIAKRIQPSTNTLFWATCSFVYFGSFLTELAKHVTLWYSCLECELKLPMTSVIGFVWEFR